jgi:methionyl-tRNA synthetase
MARRFLVTAGLPYSNGRLHVGHVAGAYLPADIYVRYLRARGDAEVRFVCGSDDNGVASLISAEREGRRVEELTAHYHARQLADFQGLGIHFDVFGGTHQPGFVERHVERSQQMFRRIHDKGYFVKRTTEQLYDPRAGKFLPDRYVTGTCYHCGNARAYGDQCEACGNAIDPLLLRDPVSTISGTRPERRSTTHWYLRLQEFEKPLAAWLESKRRSPAGDPAWRETVLNFALGQIKQGLPERAMTRDLDWGVPVPLDDPDARGKVLYVWFDAPIGYVSFTAELCARLDGDWRAYERWWKDPDTRIVHFIGEDNTVFHALIWPAMLMAEGSYQLPWQVVANSFLNVRVAGGEDEKLSKSRGNAIWIEDYLARFDPDPLRYYLTAIAPETQRTAFVLEDFVARNNGELVNALGNFVNRSLTFTERYFEGVVPAPGERSAVDREQLARIAEQAARAGAQLDSFRFKAALSEVMALARAGNVYMDAKQPWKERSTDRAACGTTMNVCLQTVSALATLMAPFLPHAAARSAVMLGRPAAPLAWDDATRELPAGQRLGTSEILFRKLDPAELETDAAPPRSS